MKSKFPIANQQSIRIMALDNIHHQGLKLVLAHRRNQSKISLVFL